jgi:type II secretion system protein D
MLLIASSAAAQDKIAAQSFRPRHLSLDAAAARLQEAFREQQLAAEVLVESKSQQIVVRGAADTLRQATRIWLGVDKPSAGKPEVLFTAGPAQPKRPAQASMAAAPAEQGDQPYALQHISPRDLEATLTQTWRQMQFQPDGREGVVSARLPGMQRGVIIIDHNRQLVRVQGDEKLTAEWQKVIVALDTKLPARNATRALVSYQKADPVQIRRAVRLLETAQKSARASRQHVAQLQPDDQPPEEAQPPEEMPGEGMEEEPAEEETRPAVGTGVRIIINEATGQIIIIGRQEDVERIVRLLQDLEQSVGKPYIEILPLKHISDRAVSDLIAQIYDQVFARTARVTITPLTKPNALLLIGPQEGVEAVKELVSRLDKPVPPSSQLRVFPLKHMNASDAESIVRNFFVERAPEQTPRPGLGTQVNVVAEPRSNSLLVQASARDLAEVAELLRRIDVIQTPKVLEVRVFKLRNSLAEDLAPVLQQAVTGSSGTSTTSGQGQNQQGNQPGATGGTTAAPSTAVQMLKVDGQARRIIESGILTDVQITADPRANSLIVRGPASSMELLSALIEQLDQLPGQTASIKVFTLLNGDAQMLLNTLQQLFGQATNQGANANNILSQLSPLVSGENVLVPLRFSVDQRTNSIIASGAPSDLEVVERILLRLDESDVRRRTTTVYRLRNAPATDVSNAINLFLQNQRQLTQAIGQNLVSQVEQIEREVVVVPEQVSNSLLVSATPRYYEEIKKIVEDLDRRPPMVIIQVVIAEVTLGNTDEFGVELGLQDSLLFHRGLPNNGGTGGIGFNFNNTNPLGNQNTFGREDVAGQALTNLGLGRGNSTLGYGGLVLSASSESVSMLIRALQRSNRLQVLSRPQVQTLDNQAGFVQVGSRVPYVTSSSQTNFGIQNQVQFQNVGLLLQVIPRTSPDGLIVMQISAEKSELGPEATGVPTFISSTGQIIRSPLININTAQTVVSAQSGQTVLLGGLITKSREQETRRTPYLSDVPVLGRLFRYDFEINTKKELLIIMTPHIVRTDEDVERLNALESERMNWCLADVASIHGDVSWARGSGPWDRPTTPMIFPDQDPTGRVPPVGEPVPAPVPTPAPPAGAPESRFNPVERDPTPDGVFEQQPR